MGTQERFTSKMRAPGFRAERKIGTDAGSGDDDGGDDDLKAAGSKELPSSKRTIDMSVPRAGPARLSDKAKRTETRR